MNGIDIVKVMDRQKVADGLHAIIKTGVALLEKDDYDKNDFMKLKTIRTLTPGLTASVMMIQQETAQQKNAIIIERMKQLGYDDRKQIE